MSITDHYNTYNKYILHNNLLTQDKALGNYMPNIVDYNHILAVDYGYEYVYTVW